MTTWYFIYESCEGPTVLALIATSEPTDEEIMASYPGIPFQLHRDDEWITGPIELPEPRPVKQATAASIAAQEENDASDA
jgi:hypothetical protein